MEFYQEVLVESDFLDNEPEVEVPPPSPPNRRLSTPNQRLSPPKQRHGGTPITPPDPRRAPLEKTTGAPQDSAELDDVALSPLDRARQRLGSLTIHSKPLRSSGPEKHTSPSPRAVPPESTIAGMPDLQFAFQIDPGNLYDLYDVGEDVDRDCPISVASMSMFDTPKSMVSIQLKTARGNKASPFAGGGTRLGRSPQADWLGGMSHFTDDLTSVEDTARFEQPGRKPSAFRQQNIDDIDSARSSNNRKSINSPSSPSSPPHRGLRKGVFSIFAKPPPQVRPDVVLVDRDGSERAISDLFPATTER